MMKEAVTAKAIAQSMSISRQRVEVRAKKEAWPFTQEASRGRGGKRRLYPLACLPADVRSAIAAAMLAGGNGPGALPNSAIVCLPAAQAAPASSSPLAKLTKHQRETALARLAFVREIERLAAAVRKEKAIRQLVDAARDGSLPQRLDALRMACLFGGIPALFYTDNGPGYVNNIMLTPGSGMLDRLGIEAVRSIPGRPQGKGLMERAVKTLCDPLSKRLPSCSHADMDGDAAKKVFKITRADLKKRGASRLLPTWETFKAALLARVEEYNATPHRGLARIEDQATGRRRHLSPNEAWQGFAARGFEPFMVPEAIRDELFMPGIPRKVRNGEVRLFNNTYFSEALADFHGDFVDVRYDIWDASKVFCWTTRGEMICTARLDGNSIDYFPQNQVEAARERRAKGQVARLAGKIARIAPGATVELPEAPQEVTLVADAIMPPAPELPELPAPEVRDVTPATTGKRPLFLSEQDRYAWLMRHRDSWTGGDHAWMDAYVRSPAYADLHDFYRYEGIAWDGNVLARAQTE